MVNIVDLQRMGQSAHETITAFITRLQGQADLCDLVTECPDCNRDIPFRDKLITYQFLRGLHDTNAQERILEASAQVEGGELSLARVVKLAEAYEMGKTTQESVNKDGGQISRISQYQQQKRTGRLNGNSQPKDNKKST